VSEHLTENFTESEMNVDAAPQQVKNNAKTLCEVLLEPIRQRWGKLRITSADRCESHNHEIGGEPKSYHLYHDGQCAADFIPLEASITQVFTWICMESNLPFDKVILEYEGEMPACIHVQYDCCAAPRRQGLVGMTHGEFHGRKYTQVIVA
jgi:zinc D-Ala-D-Ala carboxypeptidase